MRSLVCVLLLVCVATAVTAAAARNLFDGDGELRAPADLDHEHAFVSRRARDSDEAAKWAWRSGSGSGGVSVRATTNRVMRAIEAHRPLLLLPVFDSQTMLVHNSELPFGGIYKGRRGLLQFADRCAKTVQVNSITCNTTAIDEPRGTAILECVRSLTMRTTGKTVSARAILALKTAYGQTLEVINVVELDYNKLMDAYRSRPEALLHRLAFTSAHSGALSTEALALWADNVTVSYSTLSNKNIVIAHGKAELSKLNQTKESGFKFMEYVKSRMSAFTPLLTLDENRVVALEFSGDITTQSRAFRNAPQGQFQCGAGTMDVLMAYVLWEFDSTGLVKSAHTLINRPMTDLDLYWLREEYGIVLNENSK